MKKQLKSIAVTASSLVSLLAITFTTAVAAPVATNTAKLASAAGQGQAADRPTAACTKVQASDVYFVTLADDGSIDQTVDSYPSETTKVTAAFDYNCIPKKYKLNVVWSIDGQQVLTGNETPKPTDKANTYTDSIFMKDDSALPDGEYAIEFYNGEDLLTSGKITVGDQVSPTAPTTETTSITVQGTVVDSKSKKPINGALVIVLNDGVDAKQWLKDGQDSDVMASAKTDSKGAFELDNQVPVDTPLPWIVGAKGYKTILQQDFSIDSADVTADEPYVMNIALDRQK